VTEFERLQSICCPVQYLWFPSGWTPTRHWFCNSCSYHIRVAFLHNKSVIIVLMT